MHLRLSKGDIKTVPQRAALLMSGGTGMSSSDFLTLL
jgi:hypothetical protein